MAKKFNPEWLILARQYRGISRASLSKMTGIKVKDIIRIEKNIIVDIPIYDDNRYDLMSDALGFPIEFFQQERSPRPYYKCFIKYGHCFSCGECEKDNKRQ